MLSHLSRRFDQLEPARRSRGRLAGTLVLALAIAVLSSSAAAAKPLFGFNENFVVDGHDVSMTRPFRPTTGRLQINWADVEAIPGSYDWTYSDRQYKASVDQGARPVALVMGAPCWAATAASCQPIGQLYAIAPEHYRAWERFVQAALRRYPTLAAVEVWNEPNLHVMHLPRADVSGYVETLKHAYAASKAVRPDLPVLGGSLSPITTPRRTRRQGGFRRASAGQNSYAAFFARMLSLGAARYMDGVAFHPYPNFAPYVARRARRRSGTRAGFAGAIRRDIKKQITTVRRLLRKYRTRRMGIWATETGLCTSGPRERRASREEQAVGIRQIYRTLERLRVEAVLLHRVWDITTPAGPGGSIEAGCGVLDVDGARKPAWYALRRLRSATAARRR